MAELIPGYPQHSVKRREELWTEMETRMSNIWAKGARVLCVGVITDTAQKLGAIFKQAGAETVAVAPCLERVLEERNLAHAFSHVLVNLDGYSDIIHAVDDLINFRREAPRVVVICFTKSVRNDDLGPERRQICDATLRVPFDVPRLKDAFAAASKNSEAIQWPLSTCVPAQNRIC